MQLAKHKEDWEELATLDPLWAILSDPRKRFNLWDTTAFFRTGEQQVEELVAQAKLFGVPRQWTRSLDFGCGVGRVTRALHAYFPESHGVDISTEMIGKARQVAPQCFFHEHTKTNLSLFVDSDFDLICSFNVLQHQPNRAVVFAYIAEFLRVLRPGGLLAFQLPCYIPPRNRVQGGRRLYALLRGIGLSSDFLYRRLKLTPIRMLAVREEDVVASIRACGAKVLRVRSDNSPGDHVQSRTYYASR